jgi:hypothetical protein
MKILTKNKIVEAFHFPFTEALVFSILLWTTWGLAESFYWDRISTMFYSSTAPQDRFTYLEAFLIYAGVATFLGSIIYVGMRLLLALFHLHNTRTFRAATLCGILGLFFLTTIYYCWESPAWQNLSRNTGYLVMGVVVALALILLVLLYRWSVGDEFRIRRSGTMMLSILVISIVLSLVPFPLFSAHSGEKRQARSHTGYRKLMAYMYLQPLLNPHRD